MTYDQIKSSIQSLSADQQFALANSILDELVTSGRIPLSDKMREEIRQRDIEFEQNPNLGESWENVKGQIFGR